MQKIEVIDYVFKTRSKRIAQIIELLPHDKKLCDLILTFTHIKSRKRRNLVIRMAEYLGRHQGGERG